jgi:hypothetical protein
MKALSFLFKKIFESCPETAVRNCFNAPTLHGPGLISG